MSQNHCTLQRRRKREKRRQIRAAQRRKANARADAIVVTPAVTVGHLERVCQVLNGMIIAQYALMGCVYLVVDGGELRVIGFVYLSIAGSHACLSAFEKTL